MDLPAPREAIPRPPMDLPAARETVPRPVIDLPVAKAAPLPPGIDLPASRDAIPRPGIDLPAAREAVPRPQRPAPPPRAPAPVPPGAVPLDLDLIDLPPLATAAPAAPPSDNAAALGFSLRIEGADHEPHRPPSVPTVLTTPAQPVVDLSAGDELMPSLAPPRAVEPVGPAPTAARPAGRARRLRLIAVAVGLAGTLGVGFAVVAARLHASASGAAARAAFAAELARDHYATTLSVAERMVAGVPAGPKGLPARAAAAEVLLTARLSHDGPRALDRKAQEWLAGADDGNAAPPELTRARLLLATAEGKLPAARALAAQLDNGAEAERARLLLALRAGDGSAAQAAATRLRGAAGDDVGAQFLEARATELAGGAAGPLYQRVVDRAPDHLGAAVGLLRVGGADADKTYAAAHHLTTQSAPGAGSPAEAATAWVLLGRAAAQLGRLGEAKAAFTRAVALDATGVEPNLALGDWLLGEGRGAEALARFEALGPEARRSVEGQFGLGGALVATGRTAEGLALIEPAATARPRDPRGPFVRAWAAEIGTPPAPAAALELYQRALALDPGYLRASLRLAALAQRQGQPALALKALKDAENAGAAPAALQLAFGEALIAAKQPDRAEEVFRKALATEPDSTEGHLGLAAALESGGDLEGARQELETLVAKTPDAVATRERLAGLLTRLGEKPAALAQLRAAVATGTAPATLRVAVARLALDLGQLGVAESELTPLADKAPETPGVLFTLGRLREAQGELGKALQEYRKALTFDATPEVQLTFGRALAKAGKEEEAVTAFEAAANLPAAHVEKARLLLRKGETDRAVGDLKEAIRLAPKLAEAHLLLGQAYDRAGQHDQAAAAWREAIKADPELSEALFALGRLEMDRGHAAVALELLRRASARAPEKVTWLPELYFQLGYAERTAGSRPNARAAFTKYLALAADDAPARPEIERELRELARGK